MSIFQIPGVNVTSFAVSWNIPLVVTLIVMGINALVLAFCAGIAMDERGSGIAVLIALAMISSAVVGVVVWGRSSKITAEIDNVDAFIQVYQDYKVLGIQDGVFTLKER